MSVVLVGQSFTAGARQHPVGAIEVDLIAIPTAPPAPAPASEPDPPPNLPSPKPLFQQPDIVPVLEVQNEVAAIIADEYTDRTPEPQFQPDDPVPVEPIQAARVEGNVVETVQAEQQWEGMVLAALERKKRYPSAAQWRGQQDTVQLKIVIDRTGRVLEARVLQSKHIRALDAEAMELAQRASPLPAPPESILGDTIELVVPIEFFIKRNL